MSAVTPRGRASVALHLQPAQLGYRPFEYWKGPRPVLPAAQKPVSALGGASATHRPKAAAAAARITTTEIRLPGSGHPAQPPEPGPVRRASSYYPDEKEASAHFVGRHPALQSPPAPTNMGWESQAQSEGKAGPPSFEVRDATGPVELVTGSPPAYRRPPDYPRELPPRDNMGYKYGVETPWWKQKRTWVTSLVLLVIAIVVAVVAGVLTSRASRYPDYTKLNYQLRDTYSGENFFDQFDYFEGYDPAQGFVHYVPKARAEQLNLTFASSQSAVLKVDTSVGPGSNPDASTGRFSVRVSSKKQYDDGLFIFDIKHTPYGCGTWPALWLVDDNEWPANGEIDVMEAVNQATDGNQMTLHTSDNCAMAVKRKMTGNALQASCFNETNGNAGCGVQGAKTSYGAAFNSMGGGVMAMEWRHEGIRMWQFGRDAIPADITSRRPDPSTWGVATADFPNTDCDMVAHFRNQSIIANIDLCGQYAGGVYAQSGCPSNCTDFVASNPTAFQDAFWEFGAFEVYKAS